MTQDLKALEEEIAGLWAHDRDLVKRLACEIFDAENHGPCGPVVDHRKTAIRCIKRAVQSVRAVGSVFNELKATPEETT